MRHLSITTMLQSDAIISSKPASSLFFLCSTTCAVTSFSYTWSLPQNIIQLDSVQLVWIDFREAGGREEEAIVWDLRKCLKSFFNFTEGAYEIELHEITISYYQLLNSPSPVVDYFTKFKERVWYTFQIA
jgi:hypothetical protein